jgi:valyl-tRNA synthetase
MAKTSLRDPDQAGATKQTLGVVIRDLLALFHPIIPYVTEELWAELVGDGLVAAAIWPTPIPAEAPGGIEDLQALIVAVRRFRAEHGLSPKREIDMFIDDPDGMASDWWRDQAAAMARVTANYEGPPAAVAGHTRLAVGNIQAFIPLAGLVDVEAERPRLQKAIAEAEALLGRSEAKLDNPNFAERAPADVVAGERRKAEELSTKLDKLRTQLGELD